MLVIRLSRRMLLKHSQLNISKNVLTLLAVTVNLVIRG